jgi:hypothetical protein
MYKCNNKGDLVMRIVAMRIGANNRERRSPKQLLPSGKQSLGQPTPPGERRLSGVRVMTAKLHVPYLTRCI